MFPCEGETGADASGRKPVFLLPVFLLSLPNVSQLMETCFGRVLEQGIEVADDFWGGLGGFGGGWGCCAVCPGAFSPSDVTPVGFLHPYSFVVNVKPRLRQSLHL